MQGVALVAFPATSTIFTSPAGFGFASTQYGSLFLPQFVLAILASAAAPRIAAEIGLRQVLLLGLAADVLAMSALAASALLMREQGAALVLLYGATAALGFGFGATVTALNTFVEAYDARRADRAVLTLNALLGLGTALAPLLAAIFVGFGVWWLLPAAMTACVAALLAAVARQPFRLPVPVVPAPTGGRAAAGVPAGFWIYGAAIFLYGVLETLSGNWSTLYLAGERGVPPEGASLALTAFWAMVTAGRVLVAALSRRVPPRLIYLGLPMLILIAVELVPFAGSQAAGIAVFGLVGLGCSAMLPLSISFAGAAFPTLPAAAGWLIALYQLGYGVAAFGVGPLQDYLHLPLSAIFAGSGAVAISLAAVAALIAKRHAGP